VIVIYSLATAQCIWQCGPSTIWQPCQTS